MINQHQRRSQCFSQPKIHEDYPFYMRQLERNIVYCHQKYKLFRKKTLSLVKNPPVIYKSTKHTAIDFQQIDSLDYYPNSVKENNGNQLHHFLSQTRKQTIYQQTKLNQLKISQETNQKLKLFINKIQEKKRQKKRQEQSNKQNSVYKKYLQYEGNLHKLSFMERFSKERKIGEVSLKGMLNQRFRIIKNWSASEWKIVQIKDESLKDDWYLFQGSFKPKQRKLEQKSQCKE